MYWFLIPLILGFVSNLASAFTTTYSNYWGKKKGTFLTILLRDITGIPVWAAGYVLAIIQSSKMLYTTSSSLKVLCWAVIISGGVLIIIALTSIRIKAAAPSTEDSLVKAGIYSRIRHPIHSGTFLEFFGLLLLWPSLQVAIAFVFGSIWILLQTKLEESDLIKRIPEYRDYKSKVPAFIPSFRKKH